MDRQGRAPRRRARPAGLGIALALVVAVGTGCNGRLGPATVTLTRTHYNVAAQETSAQELLLNLVRLRYRDTPYFLQIASLSTNMRARAQLGADGSFPSNGPEVAGVNGVISLEESPTVTYTPLVGDRFVKQLLEPVAPEILLLLSHAGWSMERFLRLFVQEIGGVPNAPTASGPTPDREPVFEAFSEVADLLRVLQNRRQVALIRGTLTESGAEARSNGSDGVLLRFTAEALETPEFASLRERLGLEPGRDTFQLVTGLGARAPHRINVVLRSMMSAMFYASHGIAVPEADRDAGRVTTTRTREGEVFDWDLVTGRLIRIRTGRPKSPPYASVRYRGHRFYIEDDDLDSKSTFSMLNLVLALQSGELRGGGPILTLPVAQ